MITKTNSITKFVNTGAELGPSSCFRFNLKLNGQKSTRFWTISFRVKLVQDLLEDSIYSCGMTRVNRKDFPKELVATTHEVKALLQRESIFCHRNNLVATVCREEHTENKKLLGMF